MMIWRGRSFRAATFVTGPTYDHTYTHTKRIYINQLAAEILFLSYYWLFLVEMLLKWDKDAKLDLKYGIKLLHACINVVL